ncbi:hypothetical protein GCM10007320_05450 [Pseudorhodoferax aquiterrae]|uniref:Secreted protein n=1 Tax=Pseudorhodoferax aquiterrae TaxID=747304 RepID=A0ABQ3FVI4_9BURK|nr:hypothetical protein GCM10007320_05450 [Pseudorhodoferax aquiterrae]
MVPPVARITTLGNCWAWAMALAASRAAPAAKARMREGKYMRKTPGMLAFVARPGVTRRHGLVHGAAGPARARRKIQEACPLGLAVTCRLRMA